MSAWAGLGYYSRARNLHACARTVAAAGGRFPETAEGLRKLPGIGAYTAGAIAAIAFDRQEAAVDGNVERVLSRAYAVEAPLPGSRPEIRRLTQALVPPDRPGDFAQALMDLGATICTPKRPACALCPWMRPCRARSLGTQESFPRKIKVAKGSLRRGAAFVAIRSGDEAVLLRTRPPEGLLGNMAEPPGSAWEPDYDVAAALLDAPLDARWKRLPGLVRHGFTHFPLELTVFVARVALATPAPAGTRFTPRSASTTSRCPASCARSWRTPSTRSRSPRRSRAGAPGRNRRRCRCWRRWRRRSRCRIPSRVRACGPSPSLSRRRRRRRRPRRTSCSTGRSSHRPHRRGPGHRRGGRGRSGSGRTTVIAGAAKRPRAARGLETSRDRLASPRSQRRRRVSRSPSPGGDRPGRCRSPPACRRAPRARRSSRCRPEGPAPARRSCGSSR